MGDVMGDFFKGLVFGGVAGFIVIEVLSSLEAKACVSTGPVVLAPPTTTGASSAASAVVLSGGMPASCTTLQNFSNLPFIVPAAIGFFVGGLPGLLGGGLATVGFAFEALSEIH
jgi:hypothetical protein